MRILVTGAGGFIGSHLVEALLAEGYGKHVTALAHYHGRDTFGWLDEITGCTKVRGDIRDAGFMRDLIAGHDLVYHLAALGSVPYSFEAPQSVMETNVLGTLNVANACTEKHAQLIFMSTSEVYGSWHGDALLTEKMIPYPQSVYAASKLAGEHLIQAMVHAHHLRASVVRVFNTYGPRQSERAVIPRIIAQDADRTCTKVRLGNDASRAFLYVQDTVRALVAARKLRSVGPFNIAQPLAVKVSDLADILTSKPVIFSTGRPLTAEVWTLRGDSTEFRRRTGWSPHIALVDGLALTQAWFRSRSPRDLETFI